MNIHVTRPAFPTTQAADGLPRRKWTVSEILAMMKAGIIKQHDRFELIGGEIVPMSPKGVPHETVKKELNRFWTKALPSDIDILTETTLYINEHEFLEPDFIFWPRSIAVKDIKPKDIMLLVEASDSSLNYDLGRKAEIYASIGIREYWVVNATKLTVRVHRLPDGKGRADKYPRAKNYAYTQLLTPTLLPGLAVRLADVGLLPLTE
jgi:Uma2 family endonuclease